MTEHAVIRQAETATERPGRWNATRAVLREREAELLELKGPCSTPSCDLHRAHRGPCDIREASA